MKEPLPESSRQDPSPETGSDPGSQPLSSGGPLRSQEQASSRGRLQGILLIVLPALLLAMLFFPALSGSLPGRKKDAGIKADTTPPSIMLTRDNRYFVQPGEQYEEEGYAAFDNLDGDLTRHVEVSAGTDFVRYKVSDRAGNITVRFRKIPYADADSD